MIIEVFTGPVVITIGIDISICYNISYKTFSPNIIMFNNDYVAIICSTLL